jgi:hypothetical protein
MVESQYEAAGIDRCVPLSDSSSDTPNANENVPSRLVGAFCLGWVFVAAFHCVASSPFIRILISRLFYRAPSQQQYQPDTGNEKPGSLETSSLFANILSKDEHYSLRLAIFLSLASSAVTRFISLCSFPLGADSACSELQSVDHTLMEAY